MSILGIVGYVVTGVLAVAACTFVIANLLDRHQVRPRLHWDRLSLLLGLPFVGLGIAQFGYLAHQTELHCTRPQAIALCTLRSERWLHNSALTLEPDGLWGARVEEQVGQDRDQNPQYDYRVVLDTSQGELALSAWGDGGAQGYAQTINAFVADRSQSALDIRIDARWFHYLCAPIWWALGLYFLLRR